MNSDKLVSGVTAFLADYTKAFNSNNGAEIAKLYNAPCLTVRGDGSIYCFQSREEVERFFQPYVEGLYREGCRNWRYSNLEVAPIGGRCVLATMHWEPLREDGTPLRKWRQSYNLVRVDNALRILVSTFHVD